MSIEEVGLEGALCRPNSSKCTTSHTGQDPGLENEVHEFEFILGRDVCGRRGGRRRGENLLSHTHARTHTKARSHNINV